MDRSFSRRPMLLAASLICLNLGGCLSRNYNANPKNSDAARTNHGNSIATPRLEKSICRYPLGEGFIEGINVVCQSLVVKEDRAKIDSRVIRLHVIRLIADRKGSTPVIRLLGGPGAPASQVVSQPRSMWAPLLADRDLIVFDQRGSGWSEPNTQCTELSIEGPIGLRNCLKRLTAQGIDVTAYNTAESADDVADLAMAIGSKKVTIWGISFGSRLGLEVLRRHSGRLESAMIDSVVLPNIPFTLYFGKSLDDTLSRLESQCDAQEPCRKAFPGNLVEDALNELSKGPLNLSDSGPLTDAGLTSFLSSALFLDSSFKYIPKFLDAVRRRDDRTADMLYKRVFAEATPIDPAKGKPGGPPQADAMGYSVVCGNDKGTMTLEGLRQAYSGVRPAISKVMMSSSTSFLDICSEWPTRSLTGINEPVKSDVPTLVFNGEFDPATPSAWGMEAAKTLSRATVVDVAVSGHGPSRIPCGLSLVRAFLAAPDRALDTRCATERPLRFAVGNQ